MRATTSTDAAQHQVMIGYRGPGFAFKCDDLALPDNTWHRHEFVAAHTVEVIVMSGDQLQSGPTIIEQDLADHAASNELLRGAIHGGKVAAHTSSDEGVMQFVERPGVAFAILQQSQDRSRDAGLARHDQDLVDGQT